MTQPWLSSLAMGVRGTGAALPGPPVATEVLIAQMVNRFGFGRAREVAAVARRMRIDTRHLARDFAMRSERARAGCSNVDLAARAVRAALADAQAGIGEVAYLIGHTTTPCDPLPANIAHVADRLGYDGPHVELRQACTGFANALMIATGLIASGTTAPIVIVGSETGSIFFDPARANDDDGQLVNLVQMGDGAAAVVLGAPQEGDAVIEAAWYGTLGHGRAPGLSMAHGTTEFAHDFAAILGNGAALMNANRAAAERLGVDLLAVDHLVPHQVSGRVATQVARHFGCAPDRVFANAGRVGNTGSAAIWLALADLRSRGLAPGTTVGIAGAEATKYMFGGFSYRHAGRPL